MDILDLVRDFGIPVAILIAAVAALWRAWRVECRLRDRELKDRFSKLVAREDELYSLYRELALRDLNLLIRGKTGEGLLDTKKQDSGDRR